MKSENQSRPGGPSLHGGPSPQGDVLSAIAGASKLREGREGVLTLLRAVHRLDGAPLREVARVARLPLPVASAVRRELEKAGLLTRDAGVKLSDHGRRFVTDRLDFGPAFAARCEPCAGSGMRPPPAELLDAMTRLLSDAPPVDVSLDQAPCTPQTSLLRAALMFEAGALEGRRVLVLGDDDSVSLSVCLLYRSVAGRDLAHPVTVLELDPNRARFLEEVSRREGFPVRVLRHDLRDPLPADLERQFDVFETDPPYTLEGAGLFLRRARQALVNEGGALGYFSYAHRPAEDQFQLLVVIAREGFVPMAIRPGFNTYAGAAILGNTGQLMELLTVGPHADDREPWSHPLYTAEVAPRRRRYQCAQCGKVYSLGESGAPETVEALKAAGCAGCGGSVFRRLSGQERRGGPSPRQP